MSVEGKIRKAARVPIVHYRRRRWSDEFARPMMEAISYRRSVYNFAGVLSLVPDLRIDYPLTESSVVIDVGAFRGEWAIAIADRYGCRVHAYEPVPTVYEALVRATADHPTVTTWPFGLGARDESIEFALAGPGSTSVGPSEGRKVTGEIRDAASVLTELGLDRIDLCKLNIEGGEYDVLDRLYETGWFDKIDHFQIQFHDFHPDAFRRRRRIRRALAKTHDQEWNFDWVFESWKRRA